MTITSDGDELVVTGNTCKRGKEFAVSEMTDPRRTVCTTVRTALPFGTGSARSRIGADSQKLNFRPDARGKPYHRFKRLGREEVVVPNILNLGVDLIATSNILKDEKKQP